MAATNKTQAETADVSAYLAALEPASRRADGEALCALYTRVTGAEPVMWGPSMIGFGRDRYQTPAGREGEIFRVGFAPRKPALVLYGLRAGPDAEAALTRLGPHTTGKGCVYIKRLAAVDTGVLEAMVRAAWDAGAA